MAPIVERFRPRDRESEGVGQSTDDIEREAYCQGIFDLLARSSGIKNCLDIVSIDRVLACEFAEHEKCRLQGLGNGRKVRIGEGDGGWVTVSIGSLRRGGVCLGAKFTLIRRGYEGIHKLTITNRPGG